MRCPTPAQASTLHRAASFTLAVWLGGVFCLFCCGRGVAASVAEATTAAESANSEACASHACCHKKAERGDAPRESQATADLTMGGRCCAAFGQAVVLPIKKKLLDFGAAEQAPWIPLASRDWAKSPVGVHDSFYADRGEIYLRCCVFLI